MSQPGARLSSLLDNQQIARLERRRIQPQRGFTQRSRGDHLAGRGGTSTDFADYRDYNPGDDIRNVDWNIFARLNRPYLKIFRMEEERHISILLDTSASVGFHNKLERAQQLAASFAVSALIGGERLSIHMIGADDASAVLPICRGRTSLRRALAFIETAQVGGDATIDVAIQAMLKQHSGRGVCVVCSDFLTAGDIDAGLGRLAAAGLETFACQVLAGEETDPELGGDVRLVDGETGGLLDVSGADALHQLYADHLGNYTAGLAAIVRKHQGRYARFDPAAPLDREIAEHLIRQGWLR